MTFRTSTISIRVERFDDIPTYSKAFDQLTKYYQKDTATDDHVDLAMVVDEQPERETMSGGVEEGEEELDKDVNGYVVDLAAGVPGQRPTSLGSEARSR